MFMLCESLCGMVCESACRKVCRLTCAEQQQAHKILSGGSAAEVYFARKLQQLENPTLAFFKAEKPSLDARTKFGGIDAKKSYKNWAHQMPLTSDIFKRE